MIDDSWTKSARIIESRRLRIALLLSVVTIAGASCADTPRIGRTAISHGQPAYVAPPCPSLEAAGYYFPVAGSQSRTAHLDGFRRQWYSEHLRAMTQPSLSCGSGFTRAYRFLWLRTFHRPIAVLIASQDATVTMSAIELDGRGGYAPGTVTRRVDRILGLSEWAALTRTIDQVGFWRLPTVSVDDTFGADGSQWIVEGRNLTTYHVVDRWTPEPGPYRDLGLLFLELAGFRPLPDETY